MTLVFPNGVGAIRKEEFVSEFWSAKVSESPKYHSSDRAHQRHEWKHWVHVSWIRDLNLGDPVVVGTADLSAGGIGLLCPNMVHPGSIGLVMFVGADRQLKLQYAEVVHCRYLVGSMSHLVGARWIAQPAGVPEVKAEMTPDGPRILVGSLRGRPGVSRARRAPTFVATKCGISRREARP